MRHHEPPLLPDGKCHRRLKGVSGNTLAQEGDNIIKGRYHQRLVIHALMCERGVYGASLSVPGSSLTPISMQIRVSKMGIERPTI